MPSEETKEQILEDNQLICLLTEKVKTASEKEVNLQSTIRMLNEEYCFESNDIERDFTVKFTDSKIEKEKKIELSSVVLLHRFNSPQWLKHVQKSLTQLGNLTPQDLSALKPGEAFLWAAKATEGSITKRPVKIETRPRVTKHGGATIKATDDV